MARIKIPASKVKPQQDQALSKFYDVTVLDAGQRVSSRGAPEAPDDEVDAQDDDIVAIDYGNGVKLWMRADNYETSGQLVPAEVSRGKLTDWVEKTVHLLRLKPVEALGELGGEAGAMAVVRYFEKKLDPAPGLYRVSDVFTQSEPVLSPSDVKSSGETLVLLHGTASNTSGSFKALSLASGQTELSIIRNTTPEWRRLRQKYGQGILAFEHRTLSESPVDNALQLASLLPDGARLHLVSHSRGGMVGELLCLNQQLTDEHLTAFLDRGRKEDARQLKDLSALLLSKRFVIERFVRVACPARGTVLASERMDLYLSVILNLAGLIPGFAANPFFEFFKAASMQLIKQRTKADEVPGVEAMMPESPLVNLLNLRGLQSQADLAVIAGDQQGDNLLSKLRDLVTHLYYWEDHDLIVNTDSMYRGVGRTGVAHYFFDRGPDVNHFQYFSNNKTRDLLINWLTFDKTKLKESGFKELTEANLALEQTGGRRAAAEDAPTLIFVPAFMGTHMADDQGKVWLDFDALALGGADRLAKLNQTHELLGPPYQAIVDYLRNSFQVVEFPYDWTKSSVTNGAALANVIDSELQKHQRPVHIVSHSSGSLIVQAVPATVFDALTARGGHWVQLGGTPDGTYSAVAMIAGKASIVQQLQLLRYGGRDKIPALFASWPGLLELLPRKFLLPESWTDFQQKPDAAGLRQAMEARQPAAERSSLYVAGRATRTPSGFAANGDLAYSDAGDGRVLADDLPKANVWYINAAHGDLASYPPSFPAILELLQKGDTGLLLRRAPNPETRSGEQQERILFPQESDLIDAALGATNTRNIIADIATLKVSVLHGDLLNAAYPVLVGHYASDTMVSAERALDNLLDQALSRRFQMGVYPGRLGTSEIVRVKGNRPPGAVVVGLGDVGKLTEDKLRSTVVQAILRHALMVAETPGGDGAWRSAAFTSLLIGTYGGETIDVPSSVATIVRAAVEANRELRRQKLWERVRIDAVQFIEIYEDVATQAVHAVNSLNRRLRLNLNNDERVEAEAYLRMQEGCRDRRPADQYSAGWWRRIEISSEVDPPSDFHLRFNVLTDKARSEESTTTAQTRRVDSFVRKLIECPDFDGRTAVTLYQLLVPKRIRQQSNDLANLILEVDSNSAQFPWELMSRRSGMTVLPFATDVGIIRQFKTGAFDQPRAPRDNTALIAGFPKIAGFPELPGAAREAAEIHEQLSLAGYGVEPKTPVPAGGGDEVVAALFSGDYRILHLTGHGVVGPKNRSGVVIGDGDFLTADDVRNLPSTPDLVFLNCCHIGRIDPQVNKLAASLSEAFIQIGCRAVVAAGWAVNDSAAVSFAREFYSQMLAGETFGRAVLQARMLVRREHPESNTWGAYQCYGNPDYRLKLTDLGGSAQTGQTARTRNEFLQNCRNLVEDDLSRESGVAAVGKLLEDVPKDWRDGQVLCTFGDAFAHYGDFDRAVTLYRDAVTDFGAGAPINAVQKLANHLDRNAKALNLKAASAANEEDKNQLRTLAQAQLDEAIERIQWLRKLGETPERWSLLGGAYRRMALFQNRQKNLKLSRDAYGAAHNLGEQKKGEIDPYPALNWLSLRYLVGETPAALEAELTRIMKAAAEQSAAKSDYWAQIGLPDSLLVGAVIRQTLEQEKDNIIKAYAVLLRERKNRARIDSVYGGVSDMRDLMQPGTERDNLSAIADAIGRMKETVNV